MILCSLLVLLAPRAWAREVSTDFAPHGLYAAIGFGAQVYGGAGDATKAGPTARMELGIEPLHKREGMGDLLRVGLVFQGSRHNVMHYEVQAEVPSMDGPAGDFWAGRPGLVVSIRPLRSSFQLGARAELGALRWASPFDEDAYRLDVVEYLGWDPGMAGWGMWSAVGADIGVAVHDPGPALQLSLDTGFCLASPLSGYTLGARLGVVTPF